MINNFTRERTQTQKHCLGPLSHINQENVEPSEGHWLFRFEHELHTVSVVFGCLGVLYMLLFYQLSFHLGEAEP